MELKLLTGYLNFGWVVSFNRTFMELKLGFLFFLLCSTSF